MGTGNPARVAVDDGSSGESGVYSGGGNDLSTTNHFVYHSKSTS